MLGAAVGIPASSLCIMRRLHSIAKIQAVSLSRAEVCYTSLSLSLDVLMGVRNNARLSSTLAFAFSSRWYTWSSVRVFSRRKQPLPDFSEAYVVQGHRFDIYEQIGCFPVIYNTIPTFFLVHMWPLVLGLCSAWFCGMFLPIRLKFEADLWRHFSPHTHLVYSPAGPVQPVLVDKLVPHCQQVFPFDGSGLHGNFVHHPVGDFPDYLKRDCCPYHAMGQLGRHPLRF